MSFTLSLGTLILDDNHSLGKSLTTDQIIRPASSGQKFAINVVLTASDVAVDGFCFNRCWSHGSLVEASKAGKSHKFAYIWVGNSETQCPGQCAWPFHQPMYGPQNPPLVTLNNDVGLNGIVINLAFWPPERRRTRSAMATSRVRKRLHWRLGQRVQGSTRKGAYAGYPGDLLVEVSTGESFNAYGVNGRKYFLSALFDPSSSTCSPLV